MAGDAHLRASLTLDTNVRQAVEEASKGLEHLTGVAAKARDAMVKAAEKSDPFAKMSRAMERELKKIDEQLKKTPELAKLHEVARNQVIARYAREREEIEKRSAEKIAKIADANNFRNRVDKFERPINDMRGLMSSLGASADSAAGRLSSLAADAAGAFATGGAVGLALGATTTLVTTLASAWREARDATIEARKAAVTEMETANDAIQAQIDAVSGDAARRRDKLNGVSADESTARNLIGDAQENVNSISSRKNTLEQRQAEMLAEIKRRQAEVDEAAANNIRMVDKRLNQLKGAAPGLAVEISGADTELRVARSKLDYANIAAGQIRGVGADEAAAADDKKNAAAGVTAQKQRLADALETLKKLNAEYEKGQSQIAGWTDEARKSIVSATAGVDPFRALELGLKESIGRIDERLTELNTLAAKPEHKAEALAAIEELEQAKLALQEEYLAKRNDLAVGYIEKTTKPNKDRIAANKADDKEVSEWTQAGLSAGAQFTQGLKAAIESEDPMDIFGTLLQTAGSILSMIPGVGAGVKAAGGITSIIGGLFERGGVPYALHMPQGRGGLATMPGLNNDAIPAWLHPKEVVMPANIVEEEFGGLPEAAAVAAGRRSAGRRGGNVTVVQNVMAFDPASFRGVSERTVEPVLTSRIGQRQGQRVINAIRARGMAERYA